MTTLDEARAMLPELQRFRRTLHADPEVGLDLPRTQKRILDALEGLDLEISTGTGTTSVTAVLRGGKPGPVVLLRGDMDALPVDERTGLDFASTNGAMHACGHDLHVAGLLGAVRLLAARREGLAGSVIFMFQPGEEGYNGASVMLDEGLLDAAGQRAVAAYAVHVGPGERGTIRTRPETVMAGSNELSVRVLGRGGHGSMPATALDPVPALAEIITALQVMATRRFDVTDPIVLSTTLLEGGSAINVIPDSARMQATVRTLSEASLDRFRVEAARLAEGIASAHGCTAEVDFTVSYPVTVNDPTETEHAIETAKRVVGDGAVSVMPAAVMGSEDFSFVLRQVPGTFLMVGASPEGTDPEKGPYNHSPLIVFDDSVLAEQAALLAELAVDRLARA